MKPDFWKNKSVLITGVCGTVGGELLRQLCNMDCKLIVGIDNNETDLFFLTQSYTKHDNVRLFLADIRDRDKLVRKTRGIDIILHAAALKHVILCEESPHDAVLTNINGITNIIDAAEINSVSHLLFTSSDKAVNPTNVMGTTKLMGERLITAANAYRRKSGDTIFASTRFGNVLGSRGSVLPLFKRQIKSGGPITLTDPLMTRFVMSLKEAAHLVIESVPLAKGGEVFVTKMPVIRIVDLASVMIDIFAPQYGYKLQDIAIKSIGPKSGEKLYEELMNEEEVRRTIELKNFFSILPAFKNVYQKIEYNYDCIKNTEVKKAYHSSIEPAMTKKELTDYLMTHQLLEETPCAY